LESQRDISGLSTLRDVICGRLLRWWITYAADFR
jgi:hypothetical protein